MTHTDQKLLTLLSIKNIYSLVILVLWIFITFPISEALPLFNKKYLPVSVLQRQSYACLSLVYRQCPHVKDVI